MKGMIAVTLDTKDAGELLRLILDMGEMLLESGAEVNRVEDTISRIGMAYGAARMDVFVITSSMVVTLAFPDGTEVTRTRRIHAVSGTDFSRLERINAFSRLCCTSPFSIAEFRKELDALRGFSASRVLYDIGMICGAASFALFFGGALYDAFAAAAFAAAILFMQRTIGKICPNNVIYNLIVSFIIGAGICVAARILPWLNADKVMIGDIMLLIPGIAMTNSVRDVLVGDTIYGIMRLIESLLWAGALACGFMAAIWLVGGLV